MILIIRRKFDAAHFLPDYDGPCRNMHGHTWRVEAEVSGAVKQGGMVVDFKALKKAVDDALPDHLNLNECFLDITPTAENLAALLYGAIELRLTALDRDLSLESVTLWESDDAGARFTRENALYEFNPK